MNQRMDRRAAAGPITMWLAVALAPILLNALVWRLLVKTQHAELQRWRELRAVIELKPHLADLVTESNQMLTAWEPIGAGEPGPQALQTLQAVTTHHPVQIKELTTTHYEERLVQDQPIVHGAGWGWHALGMHHIDVHPLGDGRWIACVDGHRNARRFGFTRRR